MKFEKFCITLQSAPGGKPKSPKSPKSASPGVATPQNEAEAAEAAAAGSDKKKRNRGKRKNGRQRHNDAEAWAAGQERLGGALR